MMKHRHDRLDRWIGAVLKYGMLLSLAVLLLGLALYIVEPSGPEVDLSLPEIAQGVLRGDAIAVIDLGIVLLIATPLSRVITATVVFMVDREPRYAALSLIVLAMVSLAIFLG